jgi:hypothetical protein
MAVETLVTTFSFKGEIHIRPHPRDPALLAVGGVPIPVEVFEPLASESPSELTLKYPWRLDVGERDIEGLSGLQRRISSSVEGQDRCYFIPTAYLIRISQG